MAEQGPAQSYVIANCHGLFYVGGSEGDAQDYYRSQGLMLLIALLVAAVFGLWLLI